MGYFILITKYLLKRWAGARVSLAASSIAKLNIQLSEDDS
jgi:hypothetical protein